MPWHRVSIDAMCKKRIHIPLGRDVLELGSVFGVDLCAEGCGQDELPHRARKAAVAKLNSCVIRQPQHYSPRKECIERIVCDEYTVHEL